VEDNKDKNKIILKRSALPGVDMSISDFTQVHTVKVVWSKVTKKMYKEYKQTFIGLKDKLDAGDVIRVGNLGLSYRVIKLSKVTEKEGFIHRVQRLDGNSTTLTDIDAIEVGDKVKITNRRSFEQMINYAESLREGFSTEEECCCEEEEYPELCGDREPEPEPGFPCYGTACVFGFMDSVEWIERGGEGGVVPHSITSLIINGTEYITPGNEYDYDLEPTNWIPANNVYGQTYTNQVDSMNALFTLLGVDNLVRVQVVTNDIWAVTESHIGGYYLILANIVDTISFTITDNTGFTKTNTWDNGVASVTIAEEIPGYPVTNVAQGYEWATCLNIDEEPFTLNEDCLVEEPVFDAPCCIELFWSASPLNSLGLFEVGFASFYIEQFYNGYPLYRGNLQGTTPVYIWTDLSFWYITTSPAGDISGLVARYTGEEFLEWTFQHESGLEGISTKECSLGLNRNYCNQIHTYSNELRIAVVNSEDGLGYYNGRTAVQFELLELVGNVITGTWVPTGNYFEISYNNLTPGYEMREISNLGDPYGDSFNNR
jgi:hypothetical protein